MVTLTYRIKENKKRLANIYLGYIKNRLFRLYLCK